MGIPKFFKTIYQKYNEGQNIKNENFLLTINEKNLIKFDDIYIDANSLIYNAFFSIVNDFKKKQFLKLNDYDVNLIKQEYIYLYNDFKKNSKNKNAYKIKKFLNDIKIDNFDHNNLDKLNNDDIRNNFDKLKDIIPIDCESHIFANFGIKNTQIKTNNESYDIYERDALFNDICDKFIKSIDIIINNNSNENTKIHIVIDGVPPLGKIKDQKQRKYFNHMYNNVKTYNEYFSSYNIGPGTIFMENLNQIINNYFTGKNINYSSYEEYGEGEHKILQKIKKEALNKEAFENKKNIIVYSPDADVIFMFLNIPNIYVLVNSKQLTYVNKDNIIHENFIYINVNTIKNNFIDNINNNINKSNHNIIININNVIDDIIMICNIFGNDYVCKLPELNIQGNKKIKMPDIIDLVCQKYIKTLIEYNLFNKHIRYPINYITSTKDHQTSINFKINYKFFLNFLINIECCYGYDNNNIIDPLVNNMNRLPDEDHKFNIKFNNGDFNYDEINNKIDKYDYYSSNFYLDYNDELKFYDNVDKICNEYINSITWTTSYYVHKCYDWNYYYPYYRAPLLNDLIYYLSNNNNNYNNKIFIDYVKYNNVDITTTLKPIDQLILVLPSYEIFNDVCLYNIDQNNVIKIKNIFNDKYFYPNFNNLKLSKKHIMYAKSITIINLFLYPFSALRFLNNQVKMEIKQKKEKKQLKLNILNYYLPSQQ